MHKNMILADELLDYVLRVGLRESTVARANRERTQKRSDAVMQIAPVQGQMMALLLRLMEARRGIEIGVFTGYSSLVMAEALPHDGYLLACDINRETAAEAADDWARAGVADRVELRIAPALETLDAEIAAGHGTSYDFAFIDADKAGYIDYYERCLALLRPGGLVMADNSLWHGQVVDADDGSADTLAMRAFNDHLHGDDRVDLCLLPIADGLSLARKR